MALNEMSKSLFSLALETEQREGTIKIEYHESPDDRRNFVKATKTRLIVFLVVFVSVFAALILFVAVIGLKEWSFALGGFAIAIAVILITVILSLPKKSSEIFLDEVSLSFNDYGVVIRACNGIRSTVQVMKWSDFELIVEYPLVTVGQLNGLAYIFPKRVFTQEEFEKFRLFAFAAAGKKCKFKNFKK